MQRLGKISLKRGIYKGWDCWQIQRGPLELVLVPQVGGRIMGVIWRGHDLFFTQPEREGTVIELSEALAVQEKKRELGFPLWGGDKTWLAPQGRWTECVPFLDLDSGPYDLIIEREEPEILIIQMISQLCRETGVQIGRTVTLARGTEEWSVTHRLLNRSPVAVEWGIWDVSMVLRPGRVYLPRSVSSVYPEGVRTYAEEGESVQARGEVVSELGALAVIRCEDLRAFKYGVDAQEGWLFGVVEVGGLGLVGYHKQVRADREKPYAHGCIAEVYNSDRYPYLEMEIHGPLVRLQPGESFQLEEKQALFDVLRWPRSEEEVRGYLKLNGP